MQCTSKVYISIVFSVIKNINLSKSLDLDYILKHGDRIFELAGVSQLLTMDDLPLEVIFEGHSVSVRMFAHKSNRFAERIDSFQNYGRYSDAEKTKEQFSCVLGLA